MTEDIKTKMIDFLKLQNSHCLIIHPILNKNEGFTDIKIDLPKTLNFPTTKFKITKNQSSQFALSTSAEALRQEVFALLDIKAEMYGIAFYIDNFNEFLNIDFSFLQKVIEYARRDIGIEVEDIYNSRYNGKINHENFTFNKLVTIFTPNISFSDKEFQSLKDEFELGGATLRIVTEEDINISKKYSPENVETLKLFVLEIKNLLNQNSEDVESLFQKKIESNMKVLDLHGKKYIKHPKGFTSNKPNIQGYESLIPDFLVESYNGSINLIEIERPNKIAIRKDGNQTAKFTQAISQIQQWESLLSSNPATMNRLMRDYPQICYSNKRKYTLIFGRNKSFKSENQKIEFFNQKLANTHNIEILTFDDFVNNLELVIENISKSNI